MFKSFISKPWRFCERLLEASEFIAGKQEGIETFSLYF